MQKLTFISLILGLLLFGTNCAKETPLRTLEYLETKCSDPWSTNGGEIELALMNYLDNDLMIPYSRLTVTFDSDAEQSCEACSCTTGRKITITVVNEADIAILEDNGFVLLELID